MPIEVAPPKYVLIINSIQRRIEDGTYPPGSKLPSETQLIKEFDVSRPTVVRALEILRQQEWIDALHGKGRTVRSRPSTHGKDLPAHTAALLETAESGHVTVLEAGPVVAPPRAVNALDLRDGTAVFARRRLVTVENLGPVELSTAYIPVELATRTKVGDLAPLEEGLLVHLASHHKVTFDHVVERVSARTASAEEARLLEISRRDSLLTLFLTVCDRSGKPCLALEVLFPATRHEIEDVFALG